MAVGAKSQRGVNFKARDSENMFFVVIPALEERLVQDTKMWNGLHFDALSAHVTRQDPHGLPTTKGHLSANIRRGRPCSNNRVMADGEVLESAKSYVA